jgi:hypothetical protein
LIATGPPRKRKRGRHFGTTPSYSTLIDDTPLVCGAQQTWFECEHSNTRIELLASGPHFAKELCSDCGATLRFVPKPQTVQRHRLNAFRLAKLAMSEELSKWEREFLLSIAHQNRLSPRQQEILDELVTKFLGAPNQRHSEHRNTPAAQHQTEKEKN